MEGFREKLGIKDREQHSVLRKTEQFILIKTSSKFSAGKKIQKTLFLPVETIVKEWPQQV